jgi:minor extracellular serine protease Vpr
MEPSAMKKSLYAATMCSALALSFGLGTASAQESVSASEAENSNLWFVELVGKPTADGNSLTNTRAEKAAFKKAAAAARISYTERRSFDVLFNGYSIQIDSANRAKLAGLSGVKALWPVEKIQAPEFSPVSGGSPDLVNAIAMTGANIAQNSLGLTGAGVRVAVMDTGIDYHHADLGGDGVSGQADSAGFPNSRVVAGWDFVGDTYNADPTSASYNPIPSPDAYPDDCGGHGSHVAGIVGANGELTGVAPGVSFGAYRVFGCVGSTDADIMVAAMERALADDMDVLNMSIGSSFQWPQYPTAAAATRLVNQGVIVVASIGNSGPNGGSPNGLYSGGAPGTGEKVIGVASFDNTHVTQPAFTVAPAGLTFGYTPASAAPPPPTSGGAAVSPTATPGSADDGCTAAHFAGFPAGNIALVRRGTCGFVVKAQNAQNAGASGVVLYNNAAGFLTPTVAGTPPVTIPVVMITAADGTLLNSLLPQTLTWTDQVTTVPNPTGGLISGFSSFGLAADLSLKPDIGAPGGSIYSTIPLELGGFGNNSGTSMSSPHVAGSAALVLEAKPDTSSNAMRSVLQNSADPKNWFGNPALGFLDNVHRQGAGMVDIVGSAQATVGVEPGKLSLGEGGPHVRTLTLRNTGASAVTFDVSHVAALATGPQNATSFPTIAYLLGPATVSFSAPSVAVPAGGTATVDVTITANAGLPDRSTYGGYVVLTPQGGGQTYRVPYAGLKGDYQSITVLTPTANGFPWLAQLVGTSLFNRPTGGTFTLAAGDIPQFVVHLDHQSRRVKFEAFSVAGKAWHTISNDEYVGRNSSATSFFVFTWDGTTTAGNKSYVVPDGQYVAKLSVLKALGDPANPAHWETWTSPVITIDRP